MLKLKHLVYTYVLSTIVLTFFNNDWELFINWQLNYSVEYLLLMISICKIVFFLILV